MNDIMNFSFIYTFKIFYSTKNSVQFTSQSYSAMT